MKYEILFIIRLSRTKQSCLYVAYWRGDPGRTHDRYCARRYKTEKGAKSALTQIRNKYKRPFKNAVIFRL